MCGFRIRRPRLAEFEILYRLQENREKWLSRDLDLKHWFWRKEYTDLGIKLIQFNEIYIDWFVNIYRFG